MILRVEDNPDDQALTLRALTKNDVKNEVVVVRDGAEALDRLFVHGAHAARDASVPPQVVLLTSSNEAARRGSSVARHADRS